VQGNEDGWGSTRILAYLIGSAVLIVLFVVAERRQRRPMLDLTLFRRPAFAGASLVALALSASMFAMFLYLTLYIQDVLGYNPLHAGLRFLPVTLLSFAVAPVSGRLSVRVPVRLLLGIGLLLVGGGLLAMTAITASSGWTTLIPGFLLAGAGIGMINPPLASTAVGVVAPARSGMASGINNTFRQVGIATGIAGLGAVFQHDITRKTTAALSETVAGRQALASTHAGLGKALVSGNVGSLMRSLHPAARGALAHAYHVGFTGSLTTLLEIGGVVAICGAAFAFALVRGSDFVGAPQAAGAREPSAVEVAAG
jgi:predicted MFS family arabinose efflux permease